MLDAMPEKKAILNLRLDPATRDEFAVAAKLRGASMSGLIHQFIVRTIREEKAEAPQAFTTRGVRAAEVHLAPVVATIGSPKVDDDAELRRQIQRGIDLAPTSAKKMPAKLEDKTNTIAKRKHSR